MRTRGEASGEISPAHTWSPGFRPPGCGWTGLCWVKLQPETAGALFEALFAQQPEEGTSGRTDEELLKVASDAGVDTSKALNSDPEQTVESCVTDQSFKKYVTNSTQEALDSGVDATPWVLINGKQTVDVTDETAVGAKSGVLGLQLHAGQPMTVQFKDIVLTTED